MKNFYKYEIWEDNWCFKPTSKLDFSVLSSLDYCSWFKDNRDIIEVIIQAEKDVLKPSNHQIQTLNFILDNQYEIINAIFDCYNKMILPIFQDATDIEENEIANDVSELSLIFGITNIEIPKLEGVNSYYFSIQFDFKYDDEHGLHLLFKNNKIIDFGEISYETVELYEKGLFNENGDPLDFRLYEISGNRDLILQGKYYFDENIKFQLKEKVCRAFFNCNRREIVRNIYVQHDLEEFSLKQILTMEY